LGSTLYFEILNMKNKTQNNRENKLGEPFRLWFCSGVRERRRYADRAKALILHMRQYVSTGGQTFTRDERNN
jgi:hypothetical protein